MALLLRPASPRDCAIQLEAVKEPEEGEAEAEAEADIEGEMENEAEAEAEEEDEDVHLAASLCVPTMRTSGQHELFGGF